ncbi:UbiA family prenyltransferase [Cellulomonas bogoriensis]|uniref:Ubiquinone biosynthesis protein UbiA n=1 Tax=Cellulomonas bogoriensis 69B4 = DSM 16987 TaxID=1386082 RepID=A0A0A0C187_9CELL|nr:UbiA family prenyltransferase [Cellulomonas bogoriensis]KGM13702.1 ubiquinone biosynthesis protein UbiA [Cellulomonas bogoriensis 69B4 = DSM 16987]
MPTTARGMVTASHAGPTAVVTGLSVALLVGAGAPPATITLAGTAVLAGQLSVGWSNDWVDARRDLAVRRADKPVVRGTVSVQALRRGALTAVVACLVLSVLATPAGAAAHLAAVASAWAYNVRLKATAWSPVPYAVSFGLLPVFLVAALPAEAAAAPWVVTGAALLGVGAHLTNVLPDLEDDDATGIRGLPHRWGRRATATVAPVVLAAAAMVAALAPGVALVPWRGAVLVGALLCGAAAGAAGLAGRRSSFALAMVVAALCVVLMVSAGSAITTT